MPGFDCTSNFIISVDDFQTIDPAPDPLLSCRTEQSTGSKVPGGRGLESGTGRMAATTRESDGRLSVAMKKYPLVAK
jgi:hypothetical protein